MNRTIMEAREISKTYTLGRKVEVRALRGVNLTVREGDFLAIVGASGSGKSSLLHILGLMDQPTRGELYLEGRLITDLSDGERTAARGRDIGFVFQTFNLMPALNVLENVMLTMRWGALPKAEWRSRAEELLERVGLSHRQTHYPRELSGGERQRVALARSLANRPKLLLADEPTGQLDSVTGERIVGLFGELNAAGQTVVVVTHNPEVAARAHSIYRMKDGQLRSVTAEALLAN